MNIDIPNVSGLAHIEPLNIERFASFSCEQNSTHIPHALSASGSSELASLTRRATQEVDELLTIRSRIAKYISPSMTK